VISGGFLIGGGAIGGATGGTAGGPLSGVLFTPCAMWPKNSPRFRISDFGWLCGRVLMTPFP